MKKIILFFLIILFNFSFAQKKELRKAQKLYDSGDLAGSEQILNEFESILENIDDKLKPNYKLLKGKVAKDNKNFTAAFDILINHQNRSKTTLNLLEIVAGEMLKKRSSHSFV